VRCPLGIVIQAVLGLHFNRNSSFTIDEPRGGENDQDCLASQKGGTPD
jgi:hypothetical protein